MKFDAQNRKFVQQNIDELDKNHQLDSTEVANTAKMYETPGKAHQKFIEKFLDLETLNGNKMASNHDEANLAIFIISQPLQKQIIKFFVLYRSRPFHRYVT